MKLDLPHVGEIEATFSSPNECSASSCKGSESFTRTYQPLIDTNKVDLVLFGHVHNYQRTAPLVFNKADPLKPTKTTLERCDYTNPKGTVYAIVGTGGVNIHPFKGTKASFVMVQQDLRFGHLDISFNGNTLTGNFYRNSQDMPAPASKCLPKSTLILDHFTITKTSAGSSLILPTMGSNENTKVSNPFE